MKKMNNTKEFLSFMGSVRAYARGAGEMTANVLAVNDREKDISAAIALMKGRIRDMFSILENMLSSCSLTPRGFAYNGITPQQKEKILSFIEKEAEDAFFKELADIHISAKRV